MRKLVRSKTLVFFLGKHPVILHTIDIFSCLFVASTSEVYAN